MQIDGNEYTTVHERILLLRADKVDYSIQSTYEYYPDEKRFIVKAKLLIYKANQIREFTGLDSEVVGEGTNVNDTAALENAETSAVGRALGFAGYGIGNGMASNDELKNKIPTEESILAQLDAHLLTLKTESDVDRAAEQFKCKYKELWARTAVQKKFRKRKGEVIIEQGEKK